MKIHGFCVLVLLFAIPAIQADSTPARESDENLDKQINALGQQIKALQDRIDELSKQQAPLLAEKAARAGKRWEREASTHFARVEIRGILKKSKEKIQTGFATTGPIRSEVTTWKVVVKDRSWEVRFPEKDRKLLAAAEKQINKGVILTGIAFHETKQQPQMFVSPPYSPFGPGPVPGYRPPTEYVFVVSAESLKPLTVEAGNAEAKQLQKSIEAARNRIAVLNRKGDDITRREMFELAELGATLPNLNKKLEAQLHFARVEFCGTLVKGEPEVWQIQIAANNWQLDFGNSKETKTLAEELKDKRVVITGTITAGSAAYPTVNVETLKRARE